MNIYQKYYLNSNDILAILQNGVVVFDTSALLDIHYYSDSSRKEILEEVLPRLKGRLFLPSQVYFEFLKNEKKMVNKPLAAYDALINSSGKSGDSGYIGKISLLVDEIGTSELSQISGQLKTLREATSKSIKHPFLEQEVFCQYEKKISKFEEVLKQFKQDNLIFAEEVKRMVEEQKKSIKDNAISLEPSILDVFQILEEMNYTEYKKTIQEGAIRYSEKIAPGFEDAKTKTGVRKYGDLIAWKEILKLGKKMKTDILLVTNDKKEDWWDKEQEAPVFDLLKEFQGETKHKFWTCDMIGFLNLMKDLGDETEAVSDKVIEEAKSFADEEQVVKDETYTLYTEVLNKWLIEETDLSISCLLPKNSEWRIFGKYYVYSAYNYAEQPYVIILNIIENVSYANVLHALRNIYEIKSFYERFGKEYQYHQFIVIKTKNKIDEVAKIINSKTKLRNMFYKKSVDNTLLYLENGELHFVDANHPMG